jgi:hypothetical protein
VSWYDFAHILIYFYTIGCKSLNQLVTQLKNADAGLKLPIVPQSTLADAFWRMPSKWMRTAFQQLVASIEWLEIPELKELGALWCIDGSYFPAISKMGWARVRDKVYGIKLHLSFSLNYMTPMDCIVTVGTGNERQALRQMLREGLTFIADRGYFCFDLRISSKLTPFSFFVPVTMLPLLCARLYPSNLPQRWRLSWSTCKIYRSSFSTTRTSANIAW